ncbi:MAG: phage tail length tape measure family protein [Rubrivivax sp.]|nr:phage tail length tape measure family protein [Rubrivivax sp.]
MAGSTEIGVRITLEGAQQTQQGLQQTAAGAERLGASLGKLGPGSAQAAGNLNLVGISAGQASNAMRLLPAQITDIVTGLASGQAPLTVLIQQGGQLRDSFGSVGNVFKALSTVITPTSLAVGALAGTVGALVYGIKGGQSEFDAYSRALVLTGNAAGTTAGQLSDLAAAVGGAVGGQGKAAAALAQLAAAGVQLGVGIDKAAEAAIRLERVGGPAVAQTVKAFADLAKDPLAASIKLNEQTNFLTESTYRQIKALAEQGKTAAAAAVASEAFYRSGVERSAQLEQQLGSIERGWLAIKDAIEGAKNALLSIGRPESTQASIDDLQANIARIYRLREDPTYKPDAASKRNLARLEAELDGLLRLRDAEAKLGAQQAINARQTKETIGADKDRAKGLREAEAEARKTAAVLADLNGLNADYAEDLQRLQRLRANGTLTEERYVAAVTKLIEKQPFARQLAQQTAQAERERAQALDQGARAQARYLQGLDQSIAGADKQLASIREEIVLVTEGESARERLIQARLDDAAAQAAQNLQAAEARGVGEEEYQRLSLLADKLSEVAALRRDLASATAAKDAREANEKTARDAAKEWQGVADDIRQGLTDAFRRAFESGEDFGTAFAKTIGNELKARLASAIASSLSSQIIGALLGQAVTGAAGAAGGGGNNWMQGASTLSSLYNLQSGGGLYGSVLNSTLVNGALTSNAAYGAAIGTTNIGAGSQAAMLAAQTGEFGAAGTLATSQAAAGAGSGASSWAASAGWWAALAAAAAYFSNKDYDAGFRGAQTRDAIDKYGPGISPAGGAETYVGDLFRSLGMSDRLAEVLSGSTVTARIFGRAAPRVTAAGVSGSLSGGDFSGNQFADVLEKGGWFRSSRRYTQTSELSSEIDRFFDTAAAAIFNKAKDYGAALGLPVDQLSQVTQSVRIELTDDAEKNEAAIGEALAGYGDELVKGYADALKPLTIYGETTVQTIERVGGAIAGVNDVLGTLGLTALQASIDGGVAAVALQDLFGNLGTLQQAAGGYLQNYYSDAERTTLALQGIGQVLADVGLQTPATRDAFRALVEAQDLTTQAGREAFATLLGVADAFAAVVEPARAAADILAERLQLERELLQVQGDTAAIRALERAELDASNRALYDQIRALEDQQAAAELAERAASAAAEATATAAQRMADAWAQLTAGALQGVQSAYAAVAQAVDAERQQVQSSAEQAIRLAQSRADDGIRALELQARTIETTFGGLARAMADQAPRLDGLLAGDGGRAAALQTLREGAAGALDPDALRQAAGTVAQIDAGDFATALDYRRAVAETGALLRRVGSAASGRQTAELAAIAAQQVAIEQASAEEIAALEAARNAQLYVLDQQLAEARAQASTLVRISDGVQGVAGAIGALATAITAARALQGQQAPAADTGRWLDAGNTEVWNAAGGAVAARQAGATMDGTLIKGLRTQFTAAEAQAFVNDRLQADDITGIYARAVAEGIDSAALDALMGWAPGTSLAEARRRGLPAFAAGTAYVPRTGPAIVHEGERIIPAADNADLMRILRGDGGNGALVAEVRRLRDELAAMRRETMAANHATASNTGRAARLLDDVVNGGASVTTRAEA